MQHAATHGRSSFECCDFGEAEGSLSTPDTSRWSDQYTKSTGKDASGSRVAGKEGGYQENILQEIMMMINRRGNRIRPIADSTQD